MDQIWPSSLQFDTCVIEHCGYLNNLEFILWHPQQNKLNTISCWQVHSQELILYRVFVWLLCQMHIWKIFGNLTNDAFHHFLTTWITFYSDLFQQQFQSVKDLSEHTLVKQSVVLIKVFMDKGLNQIYTWVWL